MKNEVTIYTGLTANEAETNKRRDLAVSDYGADLPYVREHYEAEIRRNLRVSAESMIRAGALLLVVREAGGHGEWGAMLERLNLERGVAARMMKLGQRYKNLSEDGQERLRSQESTSLLFELVVMDEDQFKELLETGKTGKVVMDDIEDMPFRKAREQLRLARQQKADAEARARKREDRIHELENKVEQLEQKRRTATPDDRIREHQDALNSCEQKIRTLIFAVDDAEPLVVSLLSIGRELLELGEETGLDQRLSVTATIQKLEADLRKLRGSLGISAVAAPAPPARAEVVDDDPVAEAEIWDDRAAGEVR
jgi:hypothetical protein